MHFEAVEVQDSRAGSRTWCRRRAGLCGALIGFGAGQGIGFALICPPLLAERCPRDEGPAYAPRTEDCVRRTAVVGLSGVALDAAVVLLSTVLCQHASVAAGQTASQDSGPSRLSAETTRGMVRSLLRERFNLRSRREVRELPVYELRQTRPNDRRGENIRPADVACIERDSKTPRPSPPSTLPPAHEPVPCGLRVAFGHISGGGITMEELSTALTQPSARPVSNRTPLAGAFDVVLNFTPEVLRLSGGPDPDLGRPQADNLSPAVDRTGTSLFTAVREQLGLRLDASRAPVEVLVIDSIERPTPD